MIKILSNYKLITFFIKIKYYYFIIKLKTKTFQKVQNNLKFQKITIYKINIISIFNIDIIKKFY